MSLESKIEALTKAVERLTESMNVNKIYSEPVAQTAQCFTAPTPLLVNVPSVMPEVHAASEPVPVPVPPVMPAPPTFMAPQPQVASAPFSDAKGLIDYVMSAYKSLGSKGPQIQNVLNNLGYQNINDVKPEHYGALFQGVEGLR